MTISAPTLPRRLGSPTRVAAAFAAAAVTLFGSAGAGAAVPFPTARTPAASDLGALDGLRDTAPVTVTLVLKLRDEAGLEQLVNSLYTPGQPAYHQFLSSQQFHARFAPSAETVAQATAWAARAGLSARLEAGRFLKVTGAPRAIDAAFGVRLHQYEVAGSGTVPAYRFHAPVGAPRIASAAVAAQVAGFVGFDDRPRYAPRSLHAASSAPALQRQAAARPATAASGNAPGSWTVTDLAAHYDVTPLYTQGVHGEGRTVGIVTLASFHPEDAYAYWSGVGLQVAPDRISVVDVDGGPGAPSDASGSNETTLDVEQSGGLAPAAKVVVYQAPNTDQAFIDAFARAVDDNIAETVSVSWGLWEWFDTQSQVNRPGNGRAVDALQAFNGIFLQAAVQGQSLFASAGDAGAYDVNSVAAPPDYSKTLGVDSPSSLAWITAAGGTTLPGQQVYNTPGGPFTITIASEQAWGWSYLTGLCDALGYDPIGCGIFPAGGGGGVSSYVKVPAYQQGVAGIRTTEAGQSFIDYTVSPPVDYVDLPANYAGRNVPDVSLNADPETGYALVYTGDDGTRQTIDYFGGTSFVAPQLNGITALLGQASGGRVGLLNFALYRLARVPAAYGSARAPLRDITAGDNWFYSGVPGYDPATGVGTLDVANLAKVLGASK